MAEVTIKKDDGTEISKTVSNDNIDSVSNEANSEEISKGLDKFWTEKKLGKHKDAKEKQKQLLMKYLTGNPANFFSALNESKFNVGNFGPSSISNILVDANLSKYIKKEYIKDALSITSARPAIGKGEFLFASLFNNIGFSKSTYFSDNSYSSKGIKMDLSRMQVGIEASTTVISWSADNQIENTDYIYCNISMIWPIVAVGTLVGITNVPEYSGYPQLQPQPNN